MPDPISGIVLAGSQLIGASMQASAAEEAAAAQAAGADKGIAEQRRQFDIMQQLLKPYVEAGKPALEAQQNLIGLGGAGKQQAAIAGLETSPVFQALQKQGEDAILQTASATGGLRGGNVQGALGQFRPAMLNQLIESQYNKLAGISTMGQNAATGQATIGVGIGNNISNLYGNQAAAQAGGIIGSAQPWVNALNMPAQFAMMKYGQTGKTIW